MGQWTQEFKLFKSFNRCASVQSPFFIFPRGAGEERDGGWNGLNVLNPFAAHSLQAHPSIDTVFFS
jgi:hypothetical protein